MKKIIYLLIIVLVLAFSVSACTEKEHTHSYAASVTEPTCTEQGYTTYTCSCGDSYVSDRTPAAHKWGEWKVVEDEQPPYQNGVMERTCAACGAKESTEE